MRVLLVRHAIAEDAATWAARGRADDERPLSEEGRRRMRRIAGALARLEGELELILTSPLPRARETAQILAAAYDGQPTLVERAELAPGGAASALLKLLQAQRALPAVALVGHEPALSLFAGLLLAGRERSVVEMKKGAGALVDFPGRIAAGAGVLLWHLPPGELRRLAD
jgi:phosphohistidine phosphatase